MLLSALQSGKDGIVQILMMLVIVVFSLSAHEAAHAYAAYKLGDPTAYNLGRITMNPLRHLHPVGFLSMLLVGIGWANPVPINPRNFKNPRRDMMLSSLAGPVSNLLIAIIATFLEAVSSFVYSLCATRGSVTESNYYFFYAAVLFFYCFAYLNFSLAFFNLIPCPPFDGSRIFFYFLPKRWYFKVMRYERYLGLAVMILVLLLSRIGYNPVSLIAGSIHDLTYLPFSNFFRALL